MNAPEERSSALRHAWRRYQDWASTSRAQKKQIQRARVLVLAMTVGAAVFGQLSQEFSTQQLDVAASILAYLSAVTILSTAYFANWLLGPESVRSWNRTRSLAESLKAEYFRCRLGVGRYSSQTPGTALVDKVDRLEREVKDISSLNADALPDPETEPLTIDQYVSGRLATQINRFYIPRAKTYMRLTSWAKLLSSATVIASVFIGVYGGAVGGSRAGWIAVLSTFGAAVAAFTYANRYQYLIITYQNTAAKLQSLVAEWRSKARDSCDGDEFVERCENVISRQNDEWMIVGASI